MATSISSGSKAGEAGKAGKGARSILLLFASQESNLTHKNKIENEYNQIQKSSEMSNISKAETCKSGLSNSMTESQFAAFNLLNEFGAIEKCKEKKEIVSQDYIKNVRSIIIDNPQEQFIQIYKIILVDNVAHFVICEIIHNSEITFNKATLINSENSIMNFVKNYYKATDSSTLLKFDNLATFNFAAINHAFI